MTKRTQKVEEAIKAVADGEMIVVVDDDDRENEGDLIMAASKATPEAVAFMIRHTSGILCAPVTVADARRLQLNPMVADNDAPLGTAFTITVDYKYGLTTGISASERCNTIQALANHNAGPSDFVRPGHIFPLIAKEGGVLVRSGHTEAAVDFARLAGLPETGLLAELVNDDGTVQKGAQLDAFAAQHDLKMVSVADLIHYRQQRENLVERISEFSVATEVGPARGIAYQTPFDSIQHMAVVYGSVGDGEGVLTRMHREDVVADIFGGQKILGKVFNRFQEEGRGVMIYLREGAAGVPVLDRDHTRAQGSTHNSEADRDREWKDVGIGAQILRDLGVSSIKLLSTQPHHYVGLDGFGIKIDETEIIAA